MDFKVRSIEIGDKEAKVQLFDSAGQAIFRSITNAFYRGTHGILIVFDVTDVESFENVRDWVNNVKQYATEHVVVNLCGNKIDMSRKVTTYEAREYCKKNNYNYFETSAKEGTGVEEVFNDLIEQIKEAYVIV
jgi:Ras-related protein Rab-1A